MANVKKLVLLIKCKPNQEKEIPFSYILRNVKWNQKRCPDAEIVIRVISHQQ